MTTQLSGTQKFVLMLSAMILIGIFLMRSSPVNGQQGFNRQSKVQDVVRTRTVEIVDQSGKVCARFGFVPGASPFVNSVPRLTLNNTEQGTQSLLLPQALYLLDKPAPGQKNIDHYALASLEGHSGAYSTLRLRGTDGKTSYDVFLPGKFASLAQTPYPGKGNPVIFVTDRDGVQHTLQPISEAQPAK